MNVLVTGSSGLLGSRLLHAFAARGDIVTGVDLVAPPDCPHTVRVQDCLDLFRTETEPFDLAVHCAAVVGGRWSLDHEHLAVATNCALDVWFLRWLERSGTPRAVYVSSSAVYPVTWQNQNVPVLLRESALDLGAAVLRMPDATYGWAKLTGELLVSQCPAEVMVVRPFSGYAENQGAEYPFGAFLRRARRRDDPFVIWGDGSQTRDWIHADDIVGAVLAGVDAGIHSGVTGPVNLCTGRALTMTDVASMFCEAAGYQPNFTFRRTAPRGVRYRVGHPDKMWEFYQPTISMEAGVRRAWDSEWCRDDAPVQ